MKRIWNVFVLLSVFGLGVAQASDTCDEVLPDLEQNLLTDENLQALVRGAESYDWGSRRESTYRVNQEKNVAKISCAFEFFISYSGGKVACWLVDQSTIAPQPTYPINLGNAFARVGIIQCENDTKIAQALETIDTEYYVKNHPRRQ
ncbi:MAG: hypothetical protein R3A11_10065 [Bdellovibrionota bacterium]